MRETEELARRIRDAAGEWDDKELPVQAVVSEMRDATQNQAMEIRSLRNRLAQAERQRDEWKLKVCEWQDAHTEMEKQRDEARGLLLILRDNLKDSVVSGYPVISSHDIQHCVNLIHAHLRDTGD